MGLPGDKIVIDPMTGALGYGLEYTYSVMERIRNCRPHGTACWPCRCFAIPATKWAKSKESKASAADFPAVGRRRRGGLCWRIATP